jgi:hypothetical protein
MSDKQSQKAGDNALQMQAQTQTVVINYYYGTDIDEKRARVIFQEKSPQAIKKYTREAEDIARLRIDKLGSVLIPRMEVEDALKAFADPSFQNLLVEAQKVAASTERQADYELLAELITQWTQVKEDRMSRTAIRGAVEIVGEVSDEALLGLTVLFYLPMAPILGLERIPIELEKWNKLLEQLFDSPLPQDIEWLEHLAVLGAVRMSRFGFFRSIKEKVCQALSGYVDVGILKGSDSHQTAISLLESEGLPLDILVEHDLNKDYLRVNLPHRDMIDTFEVRDSSGSMHSLTDSQRKVMESLYDLYVQDEDLRVQNVDKFMEEWDRWPTLREMRKWWESSGTFSSITSVGSVLAQANAERIGLLKTHEPSA